MSSSTYSLKASDIQNKWYIVDAKNKTLGRLASQIAYVLRGKHKATFSPHLCMGDRVIVVNADKVKLTKDKETTKLYHHHTGYTGGIKTFSAAEIRATHPERLIEIAVKGMLPHNRLGADCYRMLKVYSGETHPHTAQKPEQLPERTVRA